jgi:zinc and cadmium transporter
MVLGSILLFAFIAGVGSAVLAGALLLAPERTRKAVVPWLVSLAAGSLLGAAFADLLPEAIEGIGDPYRASLTLLAGVILFLVLERIVLYHHCHDEDCHDKVVGPLLLMGDALHNFVDGVAIAAAFLGSPSAGIAVALAVLSHEIPQEVGNVVILLESGFSRRKAFGYNVLSNSLAVVGALAGYFFLRRVGFLVPYVMGISAASFIYIAAADLLPNLHRKGRTTFAQLAVLLAGVAMMIALRGDHHH